MGVKRGILIIEDDFDTMDMLKSHFEALDYEVMELQRSKDMISTIIEQMPQIVLLDIEVLDTSELETCRSVRTNPITLDIPIIALTENLSREAKIDILEIGVDEFFIKPLDLAELTLRVKYLTQN